MPPRNEPREGTTEVLADELARRPPPPPAPRRRTELTPDLANELIDACGRYLYFEQVATACGVEPSLLEHWLAKGRAENAPELYADFAAEFLAADSDVQSFVARMFLTLAGQGKRAEQLLRFMELRWPQSAPKSFEARTANPPKVDVQALLAEPPPGLIAEMQRAGTVRHLINKEALQTPEVAAILEELGYSKREG